MSINRHKSDNFGGNTTAAGDGGSMPPEERENEVLSFIYQHGIALPPKAIYRGLKLERDITFSYRTVQNILKRLNEDGFVMRCDKDSLDNGEISEISGDSSGRRTYYYITETGVDRITSD